MADFTNPFDAAKFDSGTLRISPPANDPEVDVSIFYRHFKPASACMPILLLHGHPQTHVIFSSLAPMLAATRKWEVVVPDNRGNGASSAPPAKSGQDYSRYSKREMARDMVEVMKSLGHQKFYVVAHDRGARIAHRLALDWPECVVKMILLDIAPTLDMYEKTDCRFATAYWHWFFLLQPSLPEAFISSDPSAYLDALVTRFPHATPSNPTDQAANDWRIESYLTNLSNPASVVAMCEDYRASGPTGCDLNLDRDDRAAGTKMKCPLTVFWGKLGVIQMMYGGGKELWQNWCENEVYGRALDCGHYIPEEAPETVFAEVESFFT